MSRDKNHIKLRNSAVFIEYKRLLNVKICNVQMYSHSAILALISEKFFLATETIADIILKEKKQPKAAKVKVTNNEKQSHEQR